MERIEYRMAQITANRESPSSGNIPFTWRCALCNLKSSQSDEDSFRRHIDVIHYDEVELRSSRSTEELNAWRKELLDQGIPNHVHEAIARAPGVAPPVKTASFGSDFQKLTVGIEDVAEKVPSLSSQPKARRDGREQLATEVRTIMVSQLLNLVV
ncbi:hypothetical protein BT63DRAFT_318705 [Microthyrium microscopicum]|uniref:Uncharacterized protein n=1 Tax=Microthyrium microscopicum TaxID=703497 RepID=A0A6A6U5S4_9PEZI|nr:hypothetical protein BT63DRAFT_318705 [Microthyrium microscopicum]